jgi:hypothetical protein
MPSQFESQAEFYRQLAFISALVGGFALTFLAQMIAIGSQRRIVGWTIGFSAAAASGLMVCTLGWSLSAPAAVTPGMHAYAASSPNVLAQLHFVMCLLFLSSLLLFLISLGLSGWIRSRALGVVLCTIAGIAATGMVVVVSYFTS